MTEMEAEMGASTLSSGGRKGMWMDRVPMCENRDEEETTLIKTLEEKFGLQGNMAQIQKG